MLILTRSVNEQIAIGHDVVVTVVAIGGAKVRLGVQAPKSMPVDRAEIHQRRLAETAAPAADAIAHDRPGAQVAPT